MSALEAWQAGVDTVAKLLHAPLRRLDDARWPDRPAVVLDDRFALLEVLAASGRATVFAGVELGSDHERVEIAVKVVLPTPGFAVHSRELERERHWLTRLRHDHVVELRGHGFAGSLPYLVTRRMSGGNSITWLDTEPSTSARSQVLRDASAGLAAAASIGLAHGDVKPHNLLVSGEGRGCVCDWGSARAADDPLDPHDIADPLTTALFMAPERYSRPSAPTPAADVFSLGLSIAFILRGWHEAPEPADRANPEAWRALATRGIDAPAWTELITRCVHPDPNTRPSAAVVAALIGASSACDIVADH